MDDATAPASSPSSSREWGVGLLAMIVVAVSPLVSIGCVRIAGDRPLPALELAIVCLAAVCVVAPDSNLGLLVVLLVGVEWLASVDDPTTPWSLALAASLASFHVSMAAASVAPPSARWTRAMCRRWLRRSAALVLSAPVVWLVSVGVEHVEIGSSSVLIAVSLLVLTAAGLWARDGSFDDRSRPSH